jgi:hypothetical protein
MVSMIKPWRHFAALRLPDVIVTVGPHVVVAIAVAATTTTTATADRTASTNAAAFVQLRCCRREASMELVYSWPCGGNKHTRAPTFALGLLLLLNWWTFWRPR